MGAVGVGVNIEFVRHYAGKPRSSITGKNRQQEQTGDQV